MNGFSTAIALFRHPEQLEKLWLAYWNQSAEHFDFVTSSRLDNESFRECLDREVAWILQLRRGKEYIISSQARLHLDVPAESSDLGQKNCFIVEFFIVDLFGKDGKISIENNSDVRWLTSEEVLSGRTVDGRTVSARLVRLLNHADVIARHTS
jgi:hypothetical protein